MKAKIRKSGKRMRKGESGKRKQEWKKWDKTQTEGCDCDSQVIEYSLDFFFFLGPRYRWTFKCVGAVISKRWADPVCDQGALKLKKKKKI
jgi:hypothetical protein